MRYKSRRSLKLFAVAALLPGMISAVPQRAEAQSKTAALQMSAQDQVTARHIEQLVRDFLRNVPKNDPKVFQEFFADDVIYTRSAGVTVNKAEILKNIGVRAAKEPEVTYEADDVTVHPYGNMAVINFRLVQHNGAQTNYFRNTGTFLKRHGQWQAVAWQATKAAENK
ncbi:MAG TPA: nuclear transport factor 2 family protein [Candidatus Angelobacter sp.]|nr:nuclear transport factor 2 family protein [Candidatus Angelobacter sp.]